MAAKKSAKRRVWYSKLFRAKALSRGPARALAIVAFVAIGAWLYSAYAADAYAKYLAPTTTCANENLTDTTRKADMEASMRCMINYARSIQGIPRLADGTTLEAVAGDKSRDLVVCNSFSHTACNKAWTYWFYRDGYLPGNGDSYLIGENLAWGSGSSGSARSRMDAWLNSSEHRANIFQAKYNGQGMAVRHGDSLFGAKNVWVWVNEFGCRNGTGC